MHSMISKKLSQFPSSSINRQVTILAASISILFVLFQSWSLFSQHPVYSKPLSPLDSPVTVRVGDEIPRKIWYKFGARGLSHDAIAWTGSCIEKNPGYAVEFLTDETADAWVQKRFAHRPDIVEVYLALQIPIIKADWLRYLLLYAEGGVWSDLDVSCNSPIETWIPPQYKDEASIVVGWEFDTTWPGAAPKHELATWTVLAKPGSPHMWTAVEGVLQGLHDVARENGVDVAGITATPPMMGDIVTFCGPRRMTRSIFDSLQRMLNMTDSEFQEVESSTWFNLEPKLVGDVLILPGYSFALSMGFYDEAVSGAIGPPLVEHHYAGSWKNDKGGEFL
ncbi:hypothetical protein INS49_013542 [Diaporthe citri]|uniref:uncharacterized protein n=1 Tax=Diaporthe citri TaxID=83186 RepID=UPI001C7E9AF7|nr:uncharacterized protein INS49_013542 [Diaporthe citri]KAG6357663.1 hypothetical protein INS49_013542 [Diaporthe citri]